MHITIDIFWALKFIEPFLSAHGGGPQGQWPLAMYVIGGYWTKDFDSH